MHAPAVPHVVLVGRDELQASLRAARQTMPTFRQRLVDALELVRNGNREDALAALNAGLQEAINVNDKRWVSLFARNVGVLAEQGGDMAGAEEAYLAALESNDADPTSHVALAELYNHWGRHSLAREHAEKAFALASMSGDESILELASRVKEGLLKDPERD